MTKPCKQFNLEISIANFISVLLARFYAIELAIFNFKIL